MKFYIDTSNEVAPWCIVIEANDIHHALQRYRDLCYGMAAAPFEINRIATKPARGTKYMEI